MPPLFDFHWRKKGTFRSLALLRYIPTYLTLTPILILTLTLTLSLILSLSLPPPPPSPSPPSPSPPSLFFKQKYFGTVLSFLI